MEVLLHGVGEKQREAMMAPTPDKGDRVDQDFSSLVMNSRRLRRLCVGNLTR